MWRAINKVLSVCMALLLLTTTGVAAFDSLARMTYRTNNVEFTSTGDIYIVDGSFCINDLRITSGQDPDGANYIGQVIPLANGQLTFRVGRSGSSNVAEWFNNQMSGYNNGSVNGDRTTFDHTADKLNFAFVGDLSLTVQTADNQEGLEVTFPEIGIAQGSTTFSNNWWFGQVSGQHTHDGDGDETMLAFGSTAEGKTVYASFLRGGNGTNEITLNAIDVISEARETANKISNVESTFAELPVNGTKVTLNGFPGSYDPTVNHIQGYTPYVNQDGDEYSILTHSVSTASYAHIVAGLKNGDSKTGFKTYLEGWRHPGGVQVIGDYLFVPTEQDTSAHVNLYDLRSLSVGELRRVESFDISVEHKAGALAVTQYEDANGTAYFVLIIAHLDGENSVYHIYRAEATNGIESAEFVEIGNFTFDKDFQGFGLVTEAETNKIYMIGLWSPSEGATFADYAYLYQLDTASWSLSEELQQIHLTSIGGGIGVLGVHFRYGASVLVKDDGSLVLSATERNSVLGSGLAVNEWAA